MIKTTVRERLAGKKIDLAAKQSVGCLFRRQKISDCAVFIARH